MSQMLNYASLLQSQNLRALLRVIRQGESSQDDEAYYLRYHPTQRTTIPDLGHGHPRIYEITPTGQRSSAAGAYQFVATTWDAINEKYGLPDDFSPYYQDCHAVALVHDVGALELILDGYWQRAILLCAKVWASLPDSPLIDGGHKMAWTTAESIYRQYGGQDPSTRMPGSSKPTYGDEQPPAPIEERTVAPEPKQEWTMPPLLLGPLMQMITELIPALAAVFGKSGEKYAEKATAATKVIEIVTKATGAVNGEQAVTEMRAKPEVLAAAKTAVLSDPAIEPLLQEVGGGIEAARQFDNAPERQKFWLSGAFWISVILIPLIYMTVYRVLWGEGFSEQLRTVVVTAILSGLLGALTGFYFGAMFNNSRQQGQERKV